MLPNDPYAPPKSNVSNYVSPGKTRTLEGIRGWLILVAASVVLSPLRILTNVAPTYVNIFVSGSWERITTSGTASYNPLWMPILITEILLNIGLLITWIYIATRFFGKRRNFPTLYIRMLLATFAIQLLDAWALSFVFPQSSMLDKETSAEIMRSAVVMAIWIPYMFKSKRVKATFVR